MRILQHKNFLKSLDKLSIKIQHKAVQVIELFVSDPTHPSLRNHSLKGKRLGLRSIDVTGDFRIIFRELSDGKYELIELVQI